MASPNHPQSESKPDSRVFARPANNSGFAATDLLHVRISPPPPPPALVKSLVPPRLLLPVHFYHFGWLELLKGLFSHCPTSLTNISFKIFREIPLLPRRFAARPLAASIIMHLLGIALLPVLLETMPVQFADSSEKHQYSVVYYRVQELRTVKLPKLNPSGPGSVPGVGMPSPEPPNKGVIRSLDGLFAISRPHLADNNRQTVLQRNAPPDLQIKADLKLPNLVSPQAVPTKPRLRYSQSVARASHPKQLLERANAPEFAASSSDQSLTIVSMATPHRRPVPLINASAPVVHAPRERAGGDSGGLADSDVPTGAANNSGLLALSIDPAAPSEVVSIPSGSRHGQFAIAPGLEGDGSPGGVEGGVRRGGVGGNGSGGNESAGIGSGSSGGGGGSDSTSSGFVSLRGGDTAESLLADPGPAAAAQLVFAVPVSSLVRHNALVVSAGPIGGGGSNVYGELPCGKIYTVFLPTGTQQWSLQFCQRAQTGSNGDNRTRTTVVHTEPPILPPEARESYDFRRIVLPPEKAHKTITLRGVITKDGEVEHLEVHQGVLPVVDEAARLAFGRWKFKPAMRSGNAIRVEILVSIPADLPRPR